MFQRNKHPHRRRVLLFSSFLRRLHCLRTEGILRADRLFAAAVAFSVGSVQSQVLRLDIVGKLYLSDVTDACFQLLILNREENLHTTVEVSRHPVGTSHENLRFTVVLEVENTAVLKEISNDRADRYILA